MSGDGKKSAFLDDQTFSVEEGAAYRVFRTGAIWMNKLFFGAVTLLAVWLFLGLTGAVDPACVETIQPVAPEPGERDPLMDNEGTQCSVWLSPTAKYLGAMSAVSFALSILFGFLGLLVGKRILAMTPHAEETATRHMAVQDGPDGADEDSEE